MCGVMGYDLGGHLGEYEAMEDVPSMQRVDGRTVAIEGRSIFDKYSQVSRKYTRHDL